MAKSPFEDRDADLTTDPDSLFTGGGSQQMFSNERIETRATKKAKAKQAAESSQVIPIAKNLLEKIDKMKAAHRDISGYLEDIYAKKGKPEVTGADVELEFRARQLALKDLQELESWILRRSRNQ